jgi:hypothetical protein
MLEKLKTSLNAVGSTTPTDLTLNSPKLAESKELLAERIPLHA